MTLTDFIAKWNGKGIDFDKAYGDQCMDLMHQYVVEVLGLSDGRILAAPAAKDVYLNFSTIFGNQYFDRIANTPTGVPQKGDIILWGTGLGPYGHVAIFRDGDINKFFSFDQNFPTGSKCHIQQHDYKGVLGWLRPKTPVASSGDVVALRKEADTNWNCFVTLCTTLSVTVDTKDKDATTFRAVAKIKELQKNDTPKLQDKLNRIDKVIHE